MTCTVVHFVKEDAVGAVPSHWIKKGYGQKKYIKNIFTKKQSLVNLILIIFRQEF